VPDRRSGGGGRTDAAGSIDHPRHRSADLACRAAHRPFDLAHAPGSTERYDYGFVPARLFKAVAFNFVA
jgi:hypothetical protein